MKIALTLLFLTGVAVAQRKQCKDGDRWKKDCNDCWCNNGMAACTLKGCIHPAQAPRPARYKREDLDDRMFNCKDGETWMMECNTCTCMKGMAACTLMGCQQHLHLPVRERRDTECTPLTAWKENGQVCTCAEDGSKSCQPVEENEAMITLRHQMEQYKQCSPKTVWYVNCVDCKCQEDGTPACSVRKGCTPQPFTPPKTSCSPGEHWQEDCNNCHCSESGVSTCTRALCPSHPHFEIELPRPARSLNTRVIRAISPPPGCRPGETYFDGCNTCTCSASGPPACTYKYCPNTYGQSNGPAVPVAVAQ